MNSTISAMDDDSSMSFLWLLLLIQHDGSWVFISMLTYFVWDMRRQYLTQELSDSQAPGSDG
jgi:hypothetical protein